MEEWSRPINQDETTLGWLHVLHLWWHLAHLQLQVPLGLFGLGP